MAFMVTNYLFEILLPDLKIGLGLSIGSASVFLFLLHFAVIKRYRDLGKPWWYIFLAFVPPIGLYFGVYLLYFRRGTGNRA